MLQLIPQGSFPQKQEEVIELLQRKHTSGKLSHMGKEFVQHTIGAQDKKPVHLIRLFTGTTTACGKFVECNEAGYSELFSLHRHEVTCPQCLQHI